MLVPARLRVLKTLLFLLFLGGTKFSCAQSGYHFQNYTISDGLSQSSVLTIIQDDNYGLWFGTQDGLNKFDGYSIKVFTADNTKGLASSYILSATKGKEGILWFGTSKGLTRYNSNLEQFQHLRAKNNTLSIESISIDGNGLLWLCTTNKGIWTLDPETKKFTHQKERFPSKQAKSVLALSNNDVLVYSEDKGMRYYSSKEKRVKEIFLPEDVVVKTIQETAKNEVFLGTTRGVFKLNLHRLKIQRVAPLNSLTLQNSQVNTLLKGESNEWFLGTKNNGLFTLSKEGKLNNSKKDVLQKYSLVHDEVHHIYEDKSGTFWIGTAQGVSSFNPKSQPFLGSGTSSNPSLGLPSPNVWSFAEMKNGDMLIGTDSGVSRMNKSTGKFTHYYNPQEKRRENNTPNTCLFTISKNEILVGTMEGFYLLSINGNTYEHKAISFIPKQLADNHSRIYSIAKLRENILFLGTNKGVLQIDFAKKTVKEFTHDAQQKKTSILPGICRKIIKTKNGTLLFATSSGGISRYNEKEKQIVPHPQNEVLSREVTSYITDIYEENQTTWWLGTLGQGLVKWNVKKNEIELINAKEGLPNNVVYSILADEKNNLWLSTNKGLVRYATKTGEISSYREVNGLMSNEFNSGAAFKSSTGVLYFGGINGFNFFRPKTVLSQNTTVGVVFSRFKLENDWLRPEKNGILKKTISKTREINLAYKQRSFTIELQPTSFLNPELVEYKYELAGSNEEEIEIGNTNELRFNSLSPGSYTLQVYAREGEGEWGRPTELTIHIDAPFWLTWWFWFIIIAVLFFATRLFIRRQIDAERRKQVKLEMKIAERTKEIRNQNKKIERQKQEIERKAGKVQQQQVDLKIEKEKSEKLLRNVMPEMMADELIKHGKASARAFKVVSILFTDFVGFTQIADVMDATTLVQKLDVYFSKFDDIIVHNNLEKIKTIGDAYMCAGGVPVRNNTNPIDAVVAGIQIQHYMKTLENEAQSKGEEFWKLRLGINTGEVTAGVIGRERLAYDVWGATVNQAQRMEMMGEPGKVTITKNTFEHIEPYFECIYKGQVQSKSRGKIDMYQVEGIKAELSENGKGIYPNERFHKIVNLHHYSSINYYKAERYIMRVLEEQLSDNLYYHSIAHTKDVVTAVERIALSENITDEGLFLLKTAATYHDAGFVEQYDKNEPIGVRMAMKILPKFGYTKEHIQIVESLIYVTEIPHQPTNKLEEVICDADLDYLGRDDFHEIADRLCKELIEHGKVKSKKHWDEIQVQFLTSHRYFTKTAIEQRQQKKLQNLEEVKERLEKDEY